MGDVIRDANGIKFSDATLVPREHVAPEFHCILKDQQQISNSGLDYTQPPFSDWCIAVGEKDDLGLLLKLVPQTISIRHMEAFWDQFGELFGMPIRVGKTNSRNEGERSKITNMLENMGTAAWGLFPDGTDIEIKETTRGDAFEVYDKRIERAENRMSVAILGQTMTVKNGSSKSQSETHMKVFEKIAKSDANMLAEVVNEDLLPMMEKHGFNLGDIEFVFDESKTYTPEELASILGVIMQYYEVDMNYINDEIQIPVVGLKQQAESETPESGKQKAKGQKQKAKGKKQTVNFFD
jgi:phage gp29-like protein